jgi:hypothetical protein
MPHTTLNTHTHINAHIHCIHIHCIHTYTHTHKNTHTQTHTHTAYISPPVPHCPHGGGGGELLCGEAGAGPELRLQHIPLRVQLPTVPRF